MLETATGYLQDMLLFNHEAILDVTSAVIKNILGKGDDCILGGRPVYTTATNAKLSLEFK